MVHIPIKVARIATPCCDKWDKIENKSFQEKATKDIRTEIISWVWFDMMNLNFKGMTKVDGTIDGFDKGVLTLDFLLHQLLKKTCQMFMMVSPKLAVHLQNLFHP